MIWHYISGLISMRCQVVWLGVAGTWLLFSILQVLTLVLSSQQIVHSIFAFDLKLLKGNTISSPGGSIEYRIYFHQKKLQIICNTPVSAGDTAAAPGGRAHWHHQWGSWQRRTALRQCQAVQQVRVTKVTSFYIMKLRLWGCKLWDMVRGFFFSRMD